MGPLFDTYADVFVRPTVFDADAAPRQKRPLRVGAPQVAFFKASDGVNLRLTRYQGGSKGPGDSFAWAGRFQPDFLHRHDRNQSSRIPLRPWL